MSETDPLPNEEQPVQRKVRMTFQTSSGLLIFEPQEDITVAELAEILPAILTAMTGRPTMLGQLSLESRRHFKSQAASKVVGANGKPILGRG